MKALEKSPELRWQTAADLRGKVETIASDPGFAGSVGPMHPILASFGIHTKAASVLARLSFLGFLGFLGTVPGGERLWGFSGFFGFVGLAYLVEWNSYRGGRSRRILWCAVASTALILLVCFIWPRQTITGTLPYIKQTRTYGIESPWFEEINVYGAQQQSWNVLHVQSWSFLAGVFSLMGWLTLGSLQDSEREARKEPCAALLKLSETVQGRRKIRWPSVFLAALFFIGTAINGVVLICALMQATLGGAPPILMAIAVSAVLFVVPLVALVWRSSPQPDPAKKQIATRALSLFFVTFVVSMVVVMVCLKRASQVLPLPVPTYVSPPGITQ
jgi:hypothetical protein